MPADSLRDAAFCDVLNRELVCALGCTEPIAVAYAAALASQTLGCEPDHMDVACSGNIIKTRLSGRSMWTRVRAVSAAST